MSSVRTAATSRRQPVARGEETEMLDRPDFVTDEMLNFMDESLDRSQEDLPAWRDLRDEFTNLTPEEAWIAWRYWMQTPPPDAGGRGS